MKQYRAVLDCVPDGVCGGRHGGLGLLDRLRLPPDHCDEPYGLRSRPMPPKASTVKAAMRAGAIACSLGLVGFSAARAPAITKAAGSRHGVSAVEATGSMSVYREDTKRALIIAIGEYGTPPPHPDTGEPLRPYRPLNAGNDVPLIRGALERQGFRPEDIRVLRDADADSEGIRSALRQLVRDTRRGDVVVLHYSGHGHRITNDDPERDEEIDGYDEVLVPYGAPDDFYEGYQGELHIRDDEIGEVVAELRARAGRTGNVTVFLDACYSGTATRAGAPEFAARGSDTPLGPPAARAGVGGGPASADPWGSATEMGTGFETVEASGTRSGSDRDLAPFAVFSAASQRQVAYETLDVDGETRVGSLSYALARTLPDAAPGTTNRVLFARITEALSGKVTQTPQMEGAADAQLFSDRLIQQFPYVEVVQVRDSILELDGGTLLGLNLGTRLEVHPVGTARAGEQPAMASVVVVEATPTVARASITEGEVNESLVGSWAFVTSRSYGDLALRVRLDDALSQRDRDGMTLRLSESGIVDLVDAGADVVVEDRDGIPVARTSEDQLILALGAANVVQAVQQFARNQYLRRLSFSTSGLQVDLDFAPVEIEFDRLGRATGCDVAEWEAGAHPDRSLGGDQWRMAPGDAYRLRARNTGDRRAFVAVLDLKPLGTISVLRPRADEAPSSYELEAGAVMDLGCYQVEDEEGVELLKLFATFEPQDFRAMFATAGRRSGGGLSLLEAALAASYSSTRSSDLQQPEGQATTRAISVRVGSMR